MEYLLPFCNLIAYLNIGSLFINTRKKNSHLIMIVITLYFFLLLPTLTEITLTYLLVPLFSFILITKWNFLNLFIALSLGFSSYTLAQFLGVFFITIWNYDKILLLTEFSFLISNVVMNLIFLSLHLLLKERFSLNLQIVDRFYKNVISFFLMIIISIFTIFSDHSIIFFLSFGTNQTVFYFILVLIIIILALFLLIANYKVKSQKERELIEQAHQNELIQYVNEIKAHRHDFNSYLNTIKFLADSKNYEELNQFICSMLGEYDRINQTLSFPIPEISALLYKFEIKSQKNNITFTFSFNTDFKEIDMSYFQLSKIFDNLLSNAFESSADSLERMVDVELLETDKHYLVRITNSGNSEQFENNTSTFFEAGITTKQHGENHGMGLYIIKKILTENNGDIEIITHAERITVSVFIPKINSNN